MTIETFLMICSAAIVIAGGLYCYYQNKKTTDSDSINDTSEWDENYEFSRSIVSSDTTHIFIINPAVTPKGFSIALSNKLKEYKDLNYYIFSSRYPGNETVLIENAQKFFPNSKLRVYCCGGSGTIRNALTGITDFDRVELAYVPYGLSNDFLKSTYSEIALFQNIDALIYADAVKIDYIESNHGLALNTFSTGVDALTLKMLEDYRFFGILWRNLPYILSVVFTLVFAKTNEYEVTIDGKTFTKNINQIFFGNGGVLGGFMKFSNGANITDGVANYAIGGKEKSLGLLPVAIALAKGKPEKISKYFDLGLAKEITIRRTDDKPFYVDFDGEMRVKASKWQAKIVNKGLSFVLPKGVTLDD